MPDIYVKSGGGTKNAGNYRGIWTTAGNWAVGDRVVAVNLVSYRVHECTTAGAGDAAEPTWNTATSGTTTMAAGAVFTTRIPDAWANATVDLQRAAANDAPGDTIYLSQAHAESTAAGITFALAGTAASPTRVICGDDASAPPSTSAETASITTTGNSGISFTGTCYYVEGLTFNIGSGAVSSTMALTGTTAARAVFRNCDLVLVSTGSGADIRVSGAYSHALLENCDISFSSTAQSISNSITNATRFEWNGGSLLSGTSEPATLVETNSAFTLLSGLDLTHAGGGVNLFGQTGTGPSRAIIRNSKLPASWSGSLVTGTLPLNSRFEMHNCDSGDTNYRLHIQDYSGSIISEITIVRADGASDGTTPLVWKMVSTANAEYPMLPLESPEVVQWNDTTGSAITATVEIVTDNVTLTDAECWLEVQYLGTSGYPLGAFVSDAKADVLATAANQTSSSETWTTTGLGTPVKQKLSVTFTPQEKGFIHAVVKVAKASTTVYVDPLLVIT